jgi:biotin carboxyl carrier protein
MKNVAGLLEERTIVRLMDLMRDRGVVAFRIRSGEQELEVRWPEQGNLASEEQASEDDMEAPAAQTLLAITSPTVGTYFASSEPGKPPFVSVGQRVEAGDVVCVVESMKLMNEIAAEAGGVVVELPVPNGGSIKAGEVVCLLRLDEER